jgi:FkbH-like protein
MFRSLGRRLTPPRWNFSPRLAGLRSDVSETTEEPQGAPDQPENVRLVIWDLDDTFWRGTLTEGGIDYLEANHDVVVELARRGIISSICSRNNHADIEALLRERGIWDYFVFPSIDWTSKGLRIKRIVETAQLRPSTVLFIDDNPMNRAEAQAFVEGIRVADPATMPSLLDDPTCQGKDDRGLTRLAQYRLLQRRANDMGAAGSSEDFLRESGVTVSVETDVRPHLDRAVELINRTNQLNFTKRRLPDDGAEAGRELLDLLDRDDIDAGLVHVRDRYGDYGYCGLYVRESQPAPGQARLIHYCFSCRTLGMDVETWLFRELGCPELEVDGHVVVDIRSDKTIDWVSRRAEDDDAATEERVDRSKLSRIFMRGGCETVAISPYFEEMTHNLVSETSFLRDGFAVRFDHSVMLKLALETAGPEVSSSLETLGYMPADFTTGFADTVEGPNIFILGFWAEANDSVFRHRRLDSQALIYFNHPLGIPANELLAIDPSAHPALQECQWAMQGTIETLANYDYVGCIAPEDTTANIRNAIASLQTDARVFLIGVTERFLADDGEFHPLQAHTDLNDALRAVAASSDQVEFVDIEEFVASPSDRYNSHNHYTREAYFRIASEIRRRVDAWLAQIDAERLSTSADARP